MTAHKVNPEKSIFSLQLAFACPICDSLQHTHVLENKINLNVDVNYDHSIEKELTFDLNCSKCDSKLYYSKTF